MRNRSLLFVAPLLCLSAALPGLWVAPGFGAELTQQQTPRDPNLIVAIDKGDQARVEKPRAGEKGQKAGTESTAPSLFTAVQKEDTKLLLALLEKGANPNEQDARGRTPLFYATVDTEKGYIALTILLKNGANPNVRDKEDKTPIDAARTADNTLAIETLLAAGADAPTLALGFAVEGENVAEVKRLITAGVDPNAPGLKGNLPLLTACDMEQPEIVRLLVEHGANVNTPDKNMQPPLVHAIIYRNLSIVRLLLEHNANAKFTTEDGMTTLMYAGYPGSLEMVQLLIAHGASPKARLTDNRRSTLQLLAGSADAATLRFLLDHGAQMDLDARDSEGDTPLIEAALGQNGEAVRLLLERGANPNTMDNNHDTPLHYAVAGMVRAHRTAEDMKRYNQQDLEQKGGTPTAITDHTAEGVAIFRLLIQHGAKLQLKNAAGRTPLQEALYSNDAETAAALKQLGAR